MAKRKLAALGAAALGVLVNVPTAAHADDVYLSSTTGRSVAFYDDSNDRVTVCDNNYGDGVGTYGFLGYYGWEAIVYNGCTSDHVNGCTSDHVRDGDRVDLQVCDYPYVNGRRWPTNCSSRVTFFS